MSQKVEVLSQPAVRRISEARDHRRTIVMLASLSVLVIAALVAAILAPRWATGAEELSLPEAQSSLASKVSEAAFLAANPEVRLYRAHAAKMARLDYAAFLAANPEVRTLLRYKPVANPPVTVDIIAQNPELRIFLSHAAQVEAKANAEFAASNPELRILQRFAAQQQEQ